MKPLTYFLSIATLVVLVSCTDPIEEAKMPEGEFAFYITGISQSLDYTFNSGRLNETPAEVRELTILVLDDAGNLVYEQWYYNHNYWRNQDNSGDDVIFYENTIPDTLFIPPLPAGNYEVLASTTWMNYHAEPYTNPDGTWNEGPFTYPRIESWNANESPIYVGKESITLTSDNQEVQLNMRHLSARIKLLQDPNSTNIVEGGHVNLIFKTKNNQYFSFATNELLPTEYDYDDHVYTYMYDQPEMNFYVLPKALTSVTISYYHNTVDMYNFEVEIPIDPYINLNTNDAVTFTINLDDLLNGANSGTVLWEDITWNDLGEISIP